MTSFEIAKAFLKFFEERGHIIVPSSSLVPDDPTLLFTNAGMVQFKRVFLGQEKRPYSKAASVQRCLRVSGKHNDLEQVGPSPRHHTLFFMLGNFSFGDYFKREAIQYAWEFVTSVLGIPKERLVLTVFSDDDEAFSAWRSLGVPDAKILRLGEETNFWSMGDVGPCGPTSELHYDFGEEYCTCKQPSCSVALNNNCGRWLEIWNLVFMQYDQGALGLKLLPQPGVDTGMGLERVVSVVQGTHSNYDTDLFRPIMQHLQKLLGHKKSEMQEQIISYRVIADHSRAMTFLLADGVLPSKEKQGYVLRMIIRRALRFGKKLGFSGPFLGEIAKVVMQTMGEAYPLLLERKEFILKAIALEEERFQHTLEAGLERLDWLMTELQSLGQRIIPGSEAFRLHDTYGFPIELTEDIAKERGFQVDRVSFEKEMERQRERSRATGGYQTDVIIAEEATKALLALPPTKFVGYEGLESKGKFLQAISLDSRYALSNIIDGEWWAIFSQTPFYAEAGGQVGDTGLIENLSRPGRAEVLDVRNWSGLYLHRIRMIQGSLDLGDRCLLQVDAERRKHIMRNHTATHILHAALRKVLGEHVKQAGSFVAPDELRFDFTHFAPLSEDEIERTEKLANEVILADLPVSISYEKLEEAKAKGAIALFTEDYHDKEKVRVVSIDDFSKELCGGTHVRRTGEIGLFKIISEEGIAAGIRRVRVATGENLLSFIKEKEKQWQEIAELLGAKKDLGQRVKEILEDQARQQEELKSLKDKLLIVKRDELLKRREELAGVSLVCAKTDLGIEDLKCLADMLEERLQRGIVILGSGADNKVSLVCKVSESLIARYNASKLMQAMTKIVGGGGGGSSRFAQGGGNKNKVDKLDEALAEGVRIIKEGT